MKKQEHQFPHLSAWIKRSCQQLHWTRDGIVRHTDMCSDKASAVWNGKDVRLSYYLLVWKLLLERAEQPRYKLTRKQLLEGLINALKKELDEL